MGQHVLRCSASVGVVFLTPGATIEELLRTADHAMYRAKQLGKNRVQLFDAKTMAQMSGRWLLEADLRTCIEGNAIEVAYQPVVSVADKTIIGYEALAAGTTRNVARFRRPNLFRLPKRQASSFRWAHRFSTRPAVKSRIGTRSGPLASR